MGWLTGDLRERGGALVAPAESWLASMPSPADFSGGGDGLRALAASIEIWADRDPEDAQSEARFVEGAGALLGLILIQHIGHGSHQAQDGAHRVRLGAHGYFDPFSAVEQALEAEDIRAELARHVAHAEAEAKGAGPVSRVVQALIDCLAVERPDLHIVHQFESSIILSDTSELDLQRTVDATSGERAEIVAGAVRKLVSMLPAAGDQGSRHTSWEEARARLLPRMCAERTLRDLRDRGQAQLWSRPLLGDLHVALTLAYDGKARYVRSEELARWKDAALEEAAAPERAVGAEPAERVALANLAARADSVRWLRADTEHGPLVFSKSGDGLDSARLLLPGVFDVVSAEVGSRVRIAVPHRDMLIACSADEPALVEVVRKRVRNDYLRAPHALSDTLFFLDANGLRND